MNQQIQSFEIDITVGKHLTVRVKRRERFVSAWAIRQALRAVFGVTHIKVATNMIWGAPDPWSPGCRPESDVTAWDKRRSHEQQGAVIAAYLYLYYQPNGAGLPVIAAAKEKVREFLPDDQVADIWNAVNASGHERSEMVARETPH